MAACADEPEQGPGRYPSPEANSAFDLKVKPPYQPFKDTATLTIWTWEKETDTPKTEVYVRSYRWKPYPKEKVEREVHTVYDLEGNPRAIIDQDGKTWRMDDRGELSFVGQYPHAEGARRILDIPKTLKIDMVDYDDKPRVVKDQEEAAARAKIHVLRPKGEAPAPAP